MILVIYRSSMFTAHYGKLNWKNALTRLPDARRKLLITMTSSNKLQAPLVYILYAIAAAASNELFTRRSYL